MSNEQAYTQFRDTLLIEISLETATCAALPHLALSTRHSALG